MRDARGPPLIRIALLGVARRRHPLTPGHDVGAIEAGPGRDTSGATERADRCTRTIRPTGRPTRSGAPVSAPEVVAFEHGEWIGVDGKPYSWDR
jgi:hypothetical protein